MRPKVERQRHGPPSARGDAGGLLGLAVLLGVCLLVDQRRYPHYQLHAWLPLCQRLTLVASLSCLAGAAGLLR